MWKVFTFLPILILLSKTRNFSTTSYRPFQLINNLCVLTGRSTRTLLPTFKCRRLDFRITKTCLDNFEPLKPHFYIVKLGFRGVYIIFLISAQKHRLWVLSRTASDFLSENLQFLEVKFSIYLNRRVFVMGCSIVYTSLTYSAGFAVLTLPLALIFPSNLKHTGK